MLKFLSPPAHGVFDYVLILVLGLAPFSLGLAGAYAWACYLLALAYLVITLSTDFPMGILRLLPYRVHGSLELVSGLAYLVAPFLFGFTQVNPAASTFFWFMGLALLGLWLLTDWSGRVHSDMPDEPHENLLGEPESL